MKKTIGRGAFMMGAFLAGFIAFTASPSIAETLFSSLDTNSKQNQPENLGKVEGSATPDLQGELPAAPAAQYVATAYSLRGKTASGRQVSRGLIAADPRFLPLGSRVRLEHPGYSGEYLVADTGGQIKGRRIDIWTPSSSEAMRFGRRTVKLTVLSYPTKRAKRTAKG